MDGKRFYSTRPENANQKVLVGIRVHAVEILTEGGQVIATHKHTFGEGRTGICDYTTTLAVLMKNSGTWKTGLLSIFRPGLSSGHSGSGSGLDYVSYLRIFLFLENGNTRDFRLMDLMEMDVRKAEKTENFNICDALVLVARITGYGINTPLETSSSLEIYDEAFLKEGDTA